ncbi:MAG TPA: trypsin-like peptidase domain-containing protein [Actinomycetota bacterium]|nr:trypsin-like peptidase domain-containing protein [Actinomycetota bacterium]
MSLHGRGVEGERTLPLPGIGPPPVQAGAPTPPIWAPPPPPASYPGPHQAPGPYPAPYPGPTTTPNGGGSWPGSGGGPWSPSGGGWQPPGMPPPAPPRRVRAALLAVAIVLAIVILVVAVSYAIVGGSQRSPVATSSLPTPAASTPGALPSDTAAPPASPPAAVVPTTPAPSTTAPPRVLSAAAIAAMVDPSTVDVNSILGFQGGTAAGTGMVLTSTGAILTNNHVIDGAVSISVQVAGVGHTYPATVVGRDVPEDVAVIQLQGASGLRVAPFGDSSHVLIGDRVVALGNALGRAGPPSVSQGLVVALDRAITATDPAAGTSEDLTGLIQTSAALQPGDSGGPLVTAGGEVIGMDTAASSRMRFNAAGGVGFAIPINHALQVADRIRAGGATAPSPAPTQVARRGILGVEVQQNGGAYVVGVIPGSPAEAAGIIPSDTIVAVDGASITSPSSLTAALAAHRPGDTVRVTWVDTLGQSTSARIRLAQASA